MRLALIAALVAVLAAGQDLDKQTHVYKNAGGCAIRLDVIRPPGDGVRPVILLKRHGVEHEFITIPGGGHGFDRAMQTPEVARAFDRALQFLARRLKP